MAAMAYNRREFLHTVAAAFAAGGLPLTARAEEALYDFAPHGQVRLLHTCDTHAQLLPVYYREPNVNLGFGEFFGEPPHIVGKDLLARHNIAEDSRLAYALTHINIAELAARYGKVGGFAHLATLTERLRAQAPRALHLDSGDLWAGSATALYTQGDDMVGAANRIGIDAMVGHWEFTYPAERVRANAAKLNGDFIAQNVFVKEESLFDGVTAYDEDSGHAFAPYTTRQMGDHRIVIIGQAFPYTPISNPQRFIPDWTFGIQAQALQETVDHVRAVEKPNAVVLLSHNGSDLDAVIARDIRGIDFILSGHTHDVFYQERVINGTVVINSGCVGKFLGCIDIAFAGGKVDSYRYRALPVFADLLPPRADMQSYIDEVRAPYADELGEVLATTDTFLYRRGNFNGTLDQLIVDALRAHYGADIAFTPGFRFGVSIAAGAITREDLMTAVGITYPESYNRDMSGAEIKAILEGVADNLYHPDPYYQHGGDMVRVGGLRYTLAPGGASGARISDMRLDNGDAVDADKTYRVAGWATVNPSDGPPVWDIVIGYLRSQGVVRIDDLNLPALKNINPATDPGITDYPPALT